MRSSAIIHSAQVEREIVLPSERIGLLVDESVRPKMPFIAENGGLGNDRRSLGVWSVIGK